MKFIRTVTVTQIWRRITMARPHLERCPQCGYDLTGKSEVSQLKEEKPARAEGAKGGK